MKNGKQSASYLRCGLYADSGREKRCTRHAIRLDHLIELVSNRIRYYVDTCYTIDEKPLTVDAKGGGSTLEQERKSFAVQLEKRNQALKNLYLDKASGLIEDQQFRELNQTFLAEKAELECRIECLSQQISERKDLHQNDSVLDQARELLRLTQVPRELVVMLVKQIEIGERGPQSGEQEVRITWKF